jgi:hypothetical protein
MPTRLSAPLLVPALSALWMAAAPATPAAKAAPADLAAFVKALPTTGAHDRVFLAPSPELASRLGIDLSVLRTIDPGLACDPDAKTPNAPAATLGRAATVQTICTPDGTSMGILVMADGTTYYTTCGESGLRVHAWADVTVGEHALHASTGPAAPAHAPTHACTGWAKQPR